MKLCIKSYSSQIPTFIFFSPKSKEVDEGEIHFVLCSLYRACAGPSAGSPCALGVSLCT